MFDFFKKNKSSADLDAKGLRDSILSLLKEELQKLEGGEGAHVAELQLFINAPENQRHIYDSALYTADPEQFKEEVQRIADNFAMDLPAGWQMNVQFTTEIPAAAIKREGLDAGLIIQTAAAQKKSVVNNTAKAAISILQGTAEQQEYIFDKKSNRINIGRERNIQANDGSFRINHIAFPEAAGNDSNKYISRQHAHIEWDTVSECFTLFADEGGVPPGNKTKIRSVRDEQLHKLNSTQIGYQLKAGDQIILGDAAVMEFTLLFT